jgi:AcrR family transcriptional regulator
MKQKSQSVSKACTGNPEVDDARAVRTRSNIDQAFVALLFTRPYLAIRVSDICKKAAVGRATFYAHYKSKGELLQSQLVRIVMPMIQPSHSSPFFLDCRGFFAHIRFAPELIRAVMSGGEGSGSRAVRAAMEVRLDEILIAQLPTAANLPVPLVKRFIISTLLSVVAHGLQPKATESVEEMQRQFEKLVGAGLSA